MTEAKGVYLVDKGARQITVEKDGAGQVLVWCTPEYPGIYEYTGEQAGFPDMSIVRVYRSPEYLLDEANIRTKYNLPLTDRHPPKPLTLGTVEQFKKGHVSAEHRIRNVDGEDVPQFRLVVSSKALFDKMTKGQQGISPGAIYNVVLKPGTSKFGDYDAVAELVSMNHMASVVSPRGGPNAWLTDEDGEMAEVEDKLEALRAMLEAHINSTNTKLSEVQGVLVAAKTPATVVLTDEETEAAFIARYNDRRIIVDAATTMKLQFDDTESTKSIAKKLAASSGVTLNDGDDVVAFAKGVAIVFRRKAGPGITPTKDVSGGKGNEGNGGGNGGGKRNDPFGWDDNMTRGQG